MRVHVDEHRCQGHTLCNLAAPSVFHLGDEDGHATALAGEVPAHLEERVRQAASSCPEDAIVIADDR